MWILVNCKDPIHGPGHNEERRIIFIENTKLITNPGNGITTLFAIGKEVHPHTPGETGYHCPICHKDIPPATPSTQDEETTKKAVQELRKEFEYMAIRKMFIMNRNKLGEYTSPGTFCLWAGYWECAIKLGIIPDKIEYVNEG
jgi:hypothetical protein